MPASVSHLVGEINALDANPARQMKFAVMENALRTALVAPTAIVVQAGDAVTKNAF